MPIDASIPLQVQQPNGMQTIGSILGMRSALNQQAIQEQALQAQQMENQQRGIDLQETQAAQGLMKNIQNYQDQDGNINFNKLLPDMMQAAPKNGAHFVSNVMQMQQQATEAKRSWLAASDEQRKQFGEIAASLKGQPPDVVADTFQQLRNSPTFQNMTPAVDHMFAAVKPALGDAKATDAVLDRISKQALAPQTQQEMQTPGGVTVDTGATSSVISTKPGTSVPTGQAIPGTTFVHQLPPTTPTVNAQGQPGFIGPHGNMPVQPGDTPEGIKEQIRLIKSNGGQPINPKDQPAIDAEVARLQAKLGQPPGFSPTGLPPGQAGNIENNFTEMNRHFAGLQDSASGMQLVQGLTGNIKSLANKAITGTNSDKLAFANGLLAQFGGGHAEDLKTATDLLDKNMSQLNLGTPAGTDAARALVSAARPNSHMTPEAISEAADQVAGQVRANMAMRNVLFGYKAAGDVNGYNTMRQKLEQVADPRIFQFESASPEAQRQMILQMSPQDRASMRAKIQQLQEMGLIK